MADNIHCGCRLLQRIGRGGTAAVYLGVRLSDGLLVAVKEIESEKTEVSAMAELRMAQKFHHPALPHIYSAGQENGRIYIVMDYVEGIPLEKLLREKGAQPQETVLEWSRQLCRVLDYLHGFSPPVIYRDLKPSNMILQKNGRIKLVDFGTARVYDRSKRQDTQPLGTPGYAAPEQYRKDRQSDARTDIYCLGVTMYHMLTGHDPSRPPYKICGIREWNRELSPELERIVRKCTRKNPRWRYQSCRALLGDLEALDKRKAQQAGNNLLGRLKNFLLPG